MRRLWPALLANMLCSCALQAGVSVGHTWIDRAARDPWTWGGQLQPRVLLSAPQGDWHIGAELAGHAQEPGGSVTSGGLQLGRAVDLSARTQLTVLADVGAPLGWSTQVTGYYAGLSFELPIALGSGSDPVSLNRNYRFADQEAAVVPFVRLRRYDFAVTGMRREPGYELAVGIALRMRLMSDLIDL